MPPSPTILAPTTPQSLVTYEELLNQDAEWAMSEGSLFFEGRGKVQETLKRITARLESLGIPYAVAGGMALFLHGYRRFTEDVDLLVTRDGLERIHESLDGRGYLRPFEGSKHLRDTDSKVKIEFLVSGGYPGDGKPKSIAFPEPDHVAEVIGDVRVLKLVELVNLKLASGMTGPGREKDLVDVAQLINTLHLPREYSVDLHEYVRDKFDNIWKDNHTGIRYLLLWKIQPSKLKDLAKNKPEVTFSDLERKSPQGYEQLLEMETAGVVIDSTAKPPKGHVYLMTEDPATASRFGMHEASEYMEQAD